MMANLVIGSIEMCCLLRVLSCVRVRVSLHAYVWVRVCSANLGGRPVPLSPGRVIFALTCGNSARCLFWALTCMFYFASTVNQARLRSIGISRKRRLAFSL